MICIGLCPDTRSKYFLRHPRSECALLTVRLRCGRRRRTAQIAAVVQSIQANQSQTAGLVKDQERLRENIRSLNSVTGQEQQVQRYARDLAERETRIVALRDQLQAEQQKRAALESELNAFLANVTF